MLDTEAYWNKRTTEQETTENMKPVNTNIETTKFHNGELKFSFKHSEVDEYTMDMEVFIGYKENGSPKSHLLVGDAKIKVFMPTATIFMDMGRNEDSTWVRDMVAKIYDYDKEIFKPYYSYFEDMEFIPTPFYVINSMSLLSVKIEDVLHEFLQAFLNQYDFGVIYLCPTELKASNNLSDEDMKKVKNLLNHYGFQSFDEDEEYQFFEYSNTENLVEHESKYYEKNQVMSKWYGQDIVQDIIRDLE